MPTERAHLLLVEDDEKLAGLLTEYLGAQGFELTHVASGGAGVARVLETKPDLVILDLMLPDLNGLDVCRQIRGAYAGAIMMLTASQSEADHVAGLELGADDFVIKPLEPRVLLARVRTQLRRLAGAPSVEPSRERGRIEIGALRVDGLARSVSVAECPVTLTTMEFDILLRLATQAGSVVERDVLYKETIGAEYDGLDRGLDVHVSRIRRKLERAGFDPSRLKSVRGVGYLLAPR